MKSLLSTPILTILLSLVCLLYPDHTMASAAADYSTDKMEENPYYAVDPLSKRVKRSGNLKLRGDIRTRPYNTAEKQEMLMKHNELRGQTTDASNMLMLEWDSDLEKEAQRWADRCDFNHPKGTRQVGRFKSIGQNLFVSTHEPAKATYPIQSWYDEIDFYTFSNNFQCTPGEQCGHYTQMVWATNEAVGCAIKYCDPLTSVSSFNKGYLVVCEYGPGGNIRGLYPYTKHGSCTDCPKKFKYCVRNLCSVRPYVGSKARSLHMQTSFEFTAWRIMGLVITALFLRRV